MSVYRELLGFLTVPEKERVEIQEVRLSLLNRLMRVLLSLGLVAVLFGSLRAFFQGRWIYASSYVAAYCIVLAATLTNTHFPLRLKTLLLVGSMFVISAMSFTQAGLSGPAMQVIIAACFLAAVFMGVRAGFLMLGIGLATVSTIAAAFLLGLIPINPEHMLTSASVTAWITAIACFLTVTTGLIIAPQMFISRLKESLELLEKHGRGLKRSNAILREQIRTRKKAEHALQESNGQFRLIFQTVPDAVSIVRMRDGICLDVNDQFVLETGWQREEVIGKRFKGLDMWCITRDQGRMLESLSRSGRVHNLQSVFRMKNGETITALLSAVSLTIGGEKVIVSITRDITERERAKQALEESEEKYRFVVDNANEWMVLTQNRKIVFCNRAALVQSGYSQEELSMREFSDFIHPDDREIALSRYKSKINGERLKGDYEFRLLCKEKVIWVRISSFPVDWMGNPALLQFMNDITRRKEVEAEKERLQARLQRAQKMEAIGTLAGGVAHDLNNILSGIVSYPDLLLMQLAEDSPLRKPVTTIRESGKRAAAVVQDLLTLAKRGLAVTELVDLNAIIAEFLRSAELEKLCSNHPHVRVETRLDKNLRNMTGSPVHLQKTLMNLVLNAFEAMPGGGAITIATENRRLEKSLNGYDHVHEGEYVMLLISDTGVGISPEDRDRIFEPFYTKKTMGRSGTGLGMAVVWGTIKDHKGYIDVESTVGRGTAFMLYFPATREAAKRVPPLSIDHYRGNGETIMIIDDMEDQREIASTLLSRLGYSVTAVSCGEEAVRRLDKRPVDLLILDMIMGSGMDGLDTYREIIKLCPSQKAILASGYSETSRVKEAQRLGAGQYIRKPYTLERIGTAVRGELDRRETIAA